MRITLGANFSENAARTGNVAAAVAADFSALGNQAVPLNVIL